MLTRPDGYDEAMAAGNATHVRLVFDGGTVLTDTDVEMSEGVSVTESFNSESTLRLGKTPSRMFTGRFVLNNNTRSLKWNIKFRLEFGVEDGEGNIIWINYGYFIGEKPKIDHNGGIIDFSAYDLMSSGELDDEEEAKDYIDTVASASSKKTGWYLERVNDYTVFPSWGTGYSFIADDATEYSLNRPWSSTPLTSDAKTLRDVISMIAEACGCNARVRPGDPYADPEVPDKLELAWFSDQTNVKTVPLDNIFGETHEEIYNGYTWDMFNMRWDNIGTYWTWNAAENRYDRRDYYGVVHSKNINGGVSAKYPAGVSEYPYTITKNLFMKITSTSQAEGGQIDKYLRPLYERLHSFKGVLPMTVECVGDFCVQAGDIISVELAEETVSMTILYRVLKWSGFPIDTYETTELEVV